MKDPRQQFCEIKLLCEVLSNSDIVIFLILARFSSDASNACTVLVSLFSSKLETKARERESESARECNSAGKSERAGEREKVRE